MSSHHIVREKQEPALLVLGLDNFDEELLGQLLEWSPTLIATSQTAEKLNSLGIKIDWIITDSSNVVEQSDIKVLGANGNSPADAALEYLTTFGYPSVNIITGELDLNNYLPYADKINLVIFNNGRRIFPVSPGFSKWKPAGEVIEILSPVTELQFSCLNKVDDSHYETARDGIFCLDFNEPFIFIAEYL
jgi:thiamine pyrophosphokinase